MQVSIFDISLLSVHDTGTSREILQRAITTRSVYCRRNSSHRTYNRICVLQDVGQPPRAERRFPISTLFDSRYSNKRALSLLLFHNSTISHVALFYFVRASRTYSHMRVSTLVRALCPGRLSASQAMFCSERIPLGFNSKTCSAKTAVAGLQRPIVDIYA